MNTREWVFRVFLSSTFNDFVVERDTLSERVWPTIRNCCRKRDARFQLIDLRWGISEEASQDQRTVAICLDEIRRCQDISPEFSFIALLGDRYGTRLLPDTLPTPEFEHLRATLNEDEQDRLTTWYQRDDNVVPDGAYVLRPWRGDEAPDGWKHANFTAWAPEQQTLLDYLTRACQSADITPATRQSILASVTEREIQAGILDVPDMGKSALVFQRRIEGPHDEVLTSAFFEGTELGRTRLAALEKQLMEALPSGLIPFPARYAGGRLTDEHLEEFCTLVKARVLARLDTVLATRRDATEADAARAHRRFAADRLRHFAGRDDTLATIADYLVSDDTMPLLVTGPGGVGKTALLLRALAQAEATALAQDPDTLIVYRFIGGSSVVSTLSALLHDLCQTLALAYGATDRPIPTTRENLIQQFPEFLRLATTERPLALFLDAVDQLRDARDTLNWLPATLPPHVHLVVSSLTRPTVEQWRARHPTVPVVDLRPLDAFSLGATLDGLLADTGRRLQAEQRQRALARCIATGLPLYLRLAVDMVRNWRSWQVGTRLPDLPTDVPGLLRERFAQLEAPTTHGPVLVRHALGLIGAAKDGLAEDELLDVLSQDPVTRDAIILRTPHAPLVKQVPIVLWARLAYDLEMLLTEREAGGAQLISFYHRQVGEVVQEQFLAGDDGKQRHIDLARYFATQAVANPAGAPNLRKLAEQPYQQTEGALWDDLYATLTDFRFLEEKAETGKLVHSGPDGRSTQTIFVGIYDLQEDFDRAVRRMPQGSPLQ